MGENERPKETVADQKRKQKIKRERTSRESRSRAMIKRKGQDKRKPQA